MTQLSMLRKIEPFFIKKLELSIVFLLVHKGSAFENSSKFTNQA